jgi:tRNA G46 methylase TrmB
LKEYGYEIDYASNDLYSDNIEGNIATEYEKKFVEKGIKINKLIANKK